MLGLKSKKYQPKFNDDVGSLQNSRVRRRCKEAAIKLSVLFEEVTSILASGGSPQVRSAAVNLPDYNDWDFGAHWYADYQEDRSRNELLEWVERGGLPAHVAGQEGSFVVVRLVSSVKGHSCFGVSFDSKNGRKFCIVDAGIVRDPTALHWLFKEKGAKLKSLTRKSIQSHFNNAPCHLVLPDI